MSNTKSVCHLTILLLSFCFIVAECSLEPTDQFIDSPTEAKQEDALTLHKRPSFFVGSRYGRSGSSSASGSSLFATSKTRRLNVVPRNDRFFLSSRYGKRAGMDFLQSTSNNHMNMNNNNFNHNYNHNNDNVKHINDNSILVPFLSTPYEQALISEISTGTQLSNKPIPQQQQQQQQQQHDLNDVLQQASSLLSSPSLSPSSLSSSSMPPYAYMSCVYTGLQNYYRCNSINPMFYLRNAGFNDDVEDNDVNGNAVLLDNDDDNDDDDVTDDDNVVNAIDVGDKK